MKKFMEYLNSRNKLDGSPKVKTVADVVDTPKDRMKMPPKGMGMVGGKQPYVPDDGGKPKMSSKALGDSKSENVPLYDGTRKVKPAELPTAECLSPFELAPIVRESIVSDPRTVEALVRDLKKSGLLGVLVGELLTHKEAYQEIASVLGSETYGQQVCNRLAKAIREVSVPFTDEHEHEEDQDLDPTVGDEEDHEEEDHEEEDHDDEEGEEGMDHPAPLHGGGMTDPDNPEASDEKDMEDEDEDDVPLSPAGHVESDVPAIPAVENLLRALCGLRG